MNDVPLLRNSERSDFRRCPQRWQWRYGEHLVPISFSTGPLVFGTFGHLALASWYVPGNKRGRHPADTWDEITKGYWDSVKGDKYVDDDIEGTWEDARSLGHDLLVGYVNHYGNDDHWEVLWAEQPFAQLIPHPHQLERVIDGIRQKSHFREAIVKYVGTIDLIVRDHNQNGRVRYVDHKFMKVIETEHLVIDPQNSGYLAIGTHQLRQEGVIGPNESVRDLVYNFVRKTRQDTRPQNRFGEFLNKDGTVSKKQPPPYYVRHTVTKTAKERNSQISNIGNEALWMKAVRNGKLPIIKNPSRDCKWDCSFFNLCQIHETGGNVEDTKKMMFRKEDPYQEYYEGATSPKLLQER